MGIITETDNGFTYTFPASFTEIDAVCEKVTSLLSDRDLSRHIFGVILVIREALTNAVRHGSGHGSGREVVFSVDLRENVLRIKVTDQGSGFDWRAQQDRPFIGPANNGRGMEIFKMYSDIVSFNEKGNEIKFIIFTD